MFYLHSNNTQKKLKKETKSICPYNAIWMNPDFTLKVQTQQVKWVKNLHFFYSFTISYNPNVQQYREV